MPVYFAVKSELQGVRLIYADQCLGATGAAMDLTFADHLRARAEWCGRGFCAYIDDLAIQNLHRNATTFRLGFIGTCLHELSHHLCLAKAFFDGNDSELTAVLKALADTQVEHLPSKTFTNAQVWATHHLNWVRLGLHLCCRANRCYTPLDSDYMALAGPVYGLSSARQYQMAFSSEIMEHAGTPLREVLKLPVPKAAQRLYAEDLTKRATSLTQG
jgi:hypothetical protein